MVFYLTLAAVFILDQVTKLLALAYLGHETIPVIPPIFHLTLVYNTGIAFGVLRQHPSILFVFISLSLAALFIWGVRSPMPRAQRLGMAMILGGALGNWLDRLRFGAVIDFLDFRIWPVFNVADSAITIGIVILSVFFLKQKKT